MDIPMKMDTATGMPVQEESLCESQITQSKATAGEANSAGSSLKPPEKVAGSAGEATACEANPPAITKAAVKIKNPKKVEAGRKGALVKKLKKEAKEKARFAGGAIASEASLLEQMHVPIEKVTSFAGPPEPVGFTRNTEKIIKEPHYVGDSHNGNGNVKVVKHGNVLNYAILIGTALSVGGYVLWKKYGNPIKLLPLNSAGPANSAVPKRQQDFEIPEMR